MTDEQKKAVELIRKHAITPFSEKEAEFLAIAQKFEEGEKLFELSKSVFESETLKIKITLKIEVQ